jgi:hypothetical protein
MGSTRIFPDLGFPDLRKREAGKKKCKYSFYYSGGFTVLMAISMKWLFFFRKPQLDRKKKSK